jgi:hypothetical protein
MDVIITSKLKYSMDTTVKVIATMYISNKALAINLVDAFTNEPVATATINNIITYHPDTSHAVMIKDYAENEGMLNTLIDGGIICDTDTLKAPISPYEDGCITFVIHPDVIDQYEELIVRVS